GRVSDTLPAAALLRRRSRAEGEGARRGCRVVRRLRRRREAARGRVAAAVRRAGSARLDVPGRGARLRRPRSRVRRMGRRQGAPRVAGRGAARGERVDLPLLAGAAPRQRGARQREPSRDARPAVAQVKAAAALAGRWPGPRRMSFGARILEQCDALAAISEDASILTRRYLTAEHRRAATLIAGWMRDAGSHFDSVVNAGRYDGIFGILCAIAAAGDLAARGVKLPHAIEIVAFGDEEGVRFG